MGTSRNLQLTTADNPKLLSAEGNFSSGRTNNINVQHTVNRSESDQRHGAEADWNLACRPRTGVPQKVQRGESRQIRPSYHVHIRCQAHHVVSSRLRLPGRESRLLTTLLARAKRSYPRSAYYLSLRRPAQYWYAEDDVNNQPRFPRFDYTERELTT